MRKPAGASARTTKASAVQAAGACVCGAVRFEIDVPAVWAWHDHSPASRHAQGCAYATYVGSWRSRFRILEGEEHIIRYEDEAAGTARSFCARCGTPLIYERARSPKMVNIPRAAVREPHRPRAALSPGPGPAAGLDLHRRAAGAAEGLSRRDVGAAASGRSGAPSIPSPEAASALAFVEAPRVRRPQQAKCVAKLT